MLQIQLKNIAKEYGEFSLFTELSFHVSAGDKIGIVGQNGCGKSTLLHMLARIEEPDSGQLYIKSGISTQLLRQNSETGTETVLSGEEAVYLSMLQLPADKMDQPDVLSGGEKTKVSLSKVLSQKTDILLLDEPTNNLDYEGIQTLIYMMQVYEGTLLTVSHDRYFLDQTVTKILEIEDGKAQIYNGNYSAYRDEKKRRYEEQIHRYEEGKKRQAQVETAIRQVKNWSEKAHRDSSKADPSGLKFGIKEKKRAKARKMDKQIKSQVKRLEKLKTESEVRPREEKGVYFQIRNEGSHGKRIMEGKDLSKAYGEKQLFADSSFVITRGEKAALFGANGCGKSTLVRIMEGEEAADSGEIWISPGSSPYVLPQEFSQLPGKKTVISYLTEKYGGLSGRDRTTLHNMGLSVRHLQQRLDTLSYGEQMKLKLIEPILENRDFLILDEPTNHLDLHAREMLEKNLQDYNGTILVISHDLFFLQNVCDKVLYMNDGKIQRYEETFREFAEKYL